MGAYDAAMVELILGIVREHYMLWGAWPTVEQIKAQLRQSGR